MPLNAAPRCRRANLARLLPVSEASEATWPGDDDWETAESRSQCEAEGKRIGCVKRTMLRLESQQSETKFASALIFSSADFSSTS